MPDQRALEELWHQRPKDAKLRLDFARNYLGEVRRDFPAVAIPDSDRHFAHQQALSGENLA